MSHIWMCIWTSRLTYINDHLHEWVSPSQVTYINNIHAWVITHTSMTHVTYTNKSCYVYTWVRTCERGGRGVGMSVFSHSTRKHTHTYTYTQVIDDEYFNHFNKYTSTLSVGSTFDMRRGRGALNWKNLCSYMNENDSCHISGQISVYVCEGGVERVCTLSHTAHTNIHICTPIHGLLMCVWGGGGGAIVFS